MITRRPQLARARRQPPLKRSRGFDLIAGLGVRLEISTCEAPVATSDFQIDTRGSSNA
ncbi:hypothetical protein [Phenylobacterium sp.]|uniref:hypothetical protein n=1 Tax=Phenylobacterium sp. TaxID=1871053 RepID=UPI00289B6FE7|nr:hypothetical protein [Phenylobacterium sp.]